MRKTKIVATLGPASLDPRVLQSMIEAGVDIFRLNFSYGTRQSHRAACEAVREASRACGREVAILQELRGPDLRCGEMEEGTVLATDSEVTITTRRVVGNATRIATTYKSLPVDVSPGAAVLLHGGRIRLEVLATSDNEVRCKVVRGGTLPGHAGMHLPDTEVSSPAVTSQDARDLAIGLEENIDFVAISFVRHPDDIRKVRRTLDRHGCTVRIIARIEKPEAVTHFDAILAEADGILIARSALAIEMDPECIPPLQKEMIHKAALANKHVITATSVLPSMVENPSPVHTEVFDAANAILDGTDALMLAGETATGAYPLDAVQVLDRIAREAEAYATRTLRGENGWDGGEGMEDTEDPAGYGLAALATHPGIRCIVAHVSSAQTASTLRSIPADVPVIAFTSSLDVLRQLRMAAGVEPVLNTSIHSRKDLRYYAEEYLREHALVEGTDRVLLVSGTPFGTSGELNSMDVVRFAEPPAPAVPPTPARPTRRKRKGKAANDPAAGA